MIGDVMGPIHNGTLGMYWLIEEFNTILHVDFELAPGSLKNFQCVGAVQACTRSSSCMTVRKNTPTIAVVNTIDKDYI